MTTTTTVAEKAPLRQPGWTKGPAKKPLPRKKWACGRCGHEALLHGGILQVGAACPKCLFRDVKFVLMTEVE